MSAYLTDGYYRETAAAAPTSERIKFIRRTYALVALAFAAFVGLEALLISSGVGTDIRDAMRGAWPYSALGIMVLFIGAGFLARSLARSEASPAIQLLGLAVEVGAFAIMFLPLLLTCYDVPQLSGIPLQGGILTLIVVGGLTATVFISGKDFSFLGGILCTLGWVALGVIVLAIITGGFSLGIWFSAAMLALACASILYDTSNILHHYPTNAHVPAALELFSSIALMLFYVIRLMMQLTSQD